MKNTPRTCKKCNKQLLPDEKKYCLHCADERKGIVKSVSTGIGGVAALAITVVSLGKINLKR